MTEILDVSQPESLKIAADILRRNEVIGMPTDTVYGLAALAMNPVAVERIYRLKRRPAQKALPVFVASIEHLPEVCAAIPSRAIPLLEAFFPGALTVILPAHPNLPGIVTNNGDTIAVRIPNHAGILKLLEIVGSPLAVTSANISDHPTPATAADVAAEFGSALPLVLDGGGSGDNVPSTIVDLTVFPPKVLREGAISIEVLKGTLHDIAAD